MDTHISQDWFLLENLIIHYLIFFFERKEESKETYYLIKCYPIYGNDIRMVWFYIIGACIEACV